MAGLIEQLAHLLGVAAETVFPWYVTVVRTEAIMAAIVLLLVAISAFCVCIGALRRIDRGGKDPDVLIGTLAGISGFVLLIALLVALFAMPEWAARIRQPEVEALRQIAFDISRMGGK